MTKDNPFKVKSEWNALIDQGDKAFKKATVEGDVWGADGLSGAHMIKVRFEDLFGNGETIEMWAESRKKMGKSVNIAEGMGGAYFVEDFKNVDSLIAMRLKNIDEDLIAQYRKSGNTKDLKRIEELSGNSKRKVLEGNAFDTALWNQIGDVDLFVITPHGGIDGLPINNPEEKNLILFQYIKRAYRHLNSDGGRMLFKLPEDESIHPEVASMLLQISNNGVEVSKSSRYNTIGLTKNQDSPTNLKLKL